MKVKKPFTNLSVWTPGSLNPFGIWVLPLMKLVFNKNEFLLFTVGKITYLYVSFGDIAEMNDPPRLYGNFNRFWRKHGAKILFFE